MCTSKLVVIAVFAGTFGTAYADDCGNYPYAFGMSIEDVQGGTRILSTASVGVSFDDVDAVNDARDEATVSAKTAITKFMQEGIKSEDDISRAVRETKSMQGDSKQASRNEVIDRVKRLSNSSSALLRGVVPLGDCYTPGKEFRVSVGLKPETIASAGNTANAIGKSLSTPTTPATTQAAPLPTSAPGGQPDRTGGGQPLNRVPGFSNTQNLKGF
jgi:hypothetical protein